MTPEECIQAREINATHQRASRTRRALLFVGTAIGELDIFQEQVHRLQLPPVEEICQFCQAVKWKNETTSSCYRSGKSCACTVADPPQEFKQLFVYPLL
jgi:hypothetical protein